MTARDSFLNLPLPLLETSSLSTSPPSLALSLTRTRGFAVTALPVSGSFARLRFFIVPTSNLSRALTPGSNSTARLTPPSGLARRRG